MHLKMMHKASIKQNLKHSSHRYEAHKASISKSVEFLIILATFCIIKQHKHRIKTCIKRRTKPGITTA